MQTSQVSPKFCKSPRKAVFDSIRGIKEFVTYIMGETPSNPNKSLWSPFFNLGCLAWRHQSDSLSLTHASQPSHGASVEFQQGGLTVPQSLAAGNPRAHCWNYVILSSKSCFLPIFSPKMIRNINVGNLSDWMFCYSNIAELRNRRHIISIQLYSISISPVSRLDLATQFSWHCVHLQRS